MNYFLAQIVPFANSTDGEETFWIQILVLVVLGGIVGIGSLIKTRSNRFKTQEEYSSKGVGRSYIRRGQPTEAVKELKDKYHSIFLKTAQSKTNTEKSMFDLEAADAAGRGKQKDKIGKVKDRDVNSGMEILELDFLLGIIENTKGNNENDVMMRKLVFNELIRRGQLNVVDSNALNVYSINKDKVYNKEVQCGAMMELAERTKARLGQDFELS